MEKFFLKSNQFNLTLETVLVPNCPANNRYFENKDLKFHGY